MITLAVIGTATNMLNAIINDRILIIVHLPCLPLHYPKVGFKSVFGTFVRKDSNN